MLFVCSIILWSISKQGVNINVLFSSHLPKFLVLYEQLIMLLADYLVYLPSLVIVLDNLGEIPLIAVNLLFHLLHDEYLCALLLIDALGQFIVHDLLDLLVICVAEIEHLFVVSTGLVVLDVKLLLLQQGATDALNVVEQGFSLDVTVEDWVV